MGKIELVILAKPSYSISTSIERNSREFVSYAFYV